VPRTTKRRSLRSFRPSENTHNLMGDPTRSDHRHPKKVKSNTCWVVSRFELRYYRVLRRLPGPTVVAGLATVLGG
jgi:hypothetical protein